MPPSPDTQQPGPSTLIAAAPPPRFRTGRRAHRTLAALVLAVGVTAGVSGCAQATTTSDGTSSTAASDLDRIASGNKSPSSSSNSATPLASGASVSGQQFVVPEAAKAHTKEGAIAFVKFYWDMLERLSAQPQTGIIPKFSSPACEACKMQEGKAMEITANGSHVESTGTRLTDFQVKPESTNDSVIVAFNQSKTSRVRINRDGSQHPLPNINWHVAARADWVNGEWELGMSGADER